MPEKKVGARAWSPLGACWTAAFCPVSPQRGQRELTMHACCPACSPPVPQVFVPPSVFVQLVVAAVVALVGLLATFLQAQLDWKVWASALGLLASRASSAYLQAASERSEIEREMHRLLANRTVASQEAVLHTLTDEMCRCLAGAGGRLEGGAGGSRLAGMCAASPAQLC